MELMLHLDAHFAHGIQDGRQSLGGMALVFPRVAALTGGHYLPVERRQRQIAHNIASLLFNAGQLGGESRFPPHKGNINPFCRLAGKSALRVAQDVGLPCLPFIALIAF